MVHLIPLRGEVMERAEMFLYRHHGRYTVLVLNTRWHCFTCWRSVWHFVLSSWYRLCIDYTTTGTVAILDLVTLFCFRLKHRDLLYMSSSLLMFLLFKWQKLRWLLGVTRAGVVELLLMPVLCQTLFLLLNSVSWGTALCGWGWGLIKVNIYVMFRHYRDNWLVSDEHKGKPKLTGKQTDTTLVPIVSVPTEVVLYLNLQNKSTVFQKLFNIYKDRRLRIWPKSVTALVCKCPIETVQSQLKK